LKLSCLGYETTYVTRVGAASILKKVGKNITTIKKDEKQMLEKKHTKYWARAE